MRYLFAAFALFAVACTPADAEPFLTASSISQPPFSVEVAEGNAPGWSYLRKFGEGAATTTQALIANGPTKAEAFPATSEAVKCTSDDADDTAAGSGMRSLTLSGLDASWLEASSDIILAGTNYSSNTTEVYIRVNRAWGTEAGTHGGSNQGTITCVGVTSGDTKLVIPPEHGQSQLPFYSVPDGKMFHMELMRLFPEGSKLPTINLCMRLNDDSGTIYPDRSIFEAPSLSAVVELRSVAPSSFPERTDIFFLAQTGTGTANVNAEFEGFVHVH